MTERTALFAEIDIPELEIGYFTSEKKLDLILAVLRDKDLYRDDALYCGFNGEPLRAKGTFGDRRSTWAVTEDQFREGAKETDEYDETGNNPLAYANTEELPAIAIFNRCGFENYKDGYHLDTQWRVREDSDMDSSTLAVIYFTS